MARSLPDCHKPVDSRTRLPWVERLALAFVQGERVGFAERDRDEVVAILEAVVELVTARTRRVAA
jgi:hypothetical protein